MLIGGNGNSPLSPAWSSGLYYWCPNTNSISTNGALGNGSIRASPFYVPNPIAITKIGSEITIVGEAGSVLRLGLYKDNGNGRPGNLVIDAGTIAGDSATVQEITLGTPVTIGPGWYWAAGAVQAAPTTQPTVRVASIMTAPTDVGSSIPGAAQSNFGWGGGGVPGAFPATFSGTSSIFAAPRIFVKT